LGITAGRGQRAMGSAFLGALVGAGAGYLIGEASCTRCDDAAPIIAFSGMGAALGAVVGMLVGLRWPGE